MNRETELLVPARIDAAAFRRFAVFDAFSVRKRWRSPALFAALMSMFAAVCLTMRGSREGAGLLGGVLLTVGLGLPLVYVVSYVCSVRRQAKRMGLDGRRIVYTLRLGEDGVSVTAGKERAEYRWEQIFRAYRVEGCIYLYAAPGRAFLLPEAEYSAAAWEQIVRRVPAERVLDRCGGSV